MNDKASLNLPACLIIMDGFGIAEPGDSNAISNANTPVLDSLLESCPHTLLEASGKPVGLPDGQMGNSEVGHLNIGAGRVVKQELTRINDACESGDIQSNEVIVNAIEHCKRNGSTMHLMGLVSDGGVHSSNDHLYALLRTMASHGLPDVAVHAFMDGRDVPPTSGKGYIESLQKVIDEINSEFESNIRIASISGRYYAMDRDNRWDRVQRAYETLAHGENHVSLSPTDAMQSSYDAEVTDEFVMPVSLDGKGMEDGDSVIFFNFRPDRAREITRALTESGFDGFDTGNRPDVHFVCLTEYDSNFDLPVAYPKVFPENVLADVLADAGLTQYHIAETEKYAHVTFFFNGGREEEKQGEIRKLIPSPKVATYDMQPEMSEPEVASTLAGAIEEDVADVYIVNFANCDMVGHTGSMDAAIKAVEAVDSGVGKVLDALKDKHGFALLTADHGNADKMREADGNPHTAHTTAPVPFVMIDYTGKGMSLKSQKGALADISPTFLDAIGLSAPPEMTGSDLLAK